MKTWRKPDTNEDPFDLSLESLLQRAEEAEERSCYFREKKWKEKKDGNEKRQTKGRHFTFVPSFRRHVQVRRMSENYCLQWYFAW